MAYSPIMVGLEGCELSYLDKINRKAASVVNGNILFSKNFSSKSQLKKLIVDIQKNRERLELLPALIAVDYEGGAVQRFSGEGFTKIPSAQTIGDYYLKDPDAAKQLIKDIGLVIAAELGSCGVNVCLGPSLDLNTNWSTRVTYRGYHETPDVVIDLSLSLLETLKAYGLFAVGKHYPGFGAAVFDTHHHFPIIDTAQFEMRKTHLRPFMAAIEKKVLPGVMLSHGAYIKVDIRPVAVSKQWLQVILRDELQFDGVIMTDCLGMVSANPLGENYIARINNCIRAGCDIVLMTHTQNSLYNVIKKLVENDNFLELMASAEAEAAGARIKKCIDGVKSIAYYEDILESDIYRLAKKKYSALG